MKIFQIIYCIFLTFIVLVTVLLIVSAFPIPGNYRVMVVQSGSMAPAIKMGGIVIVKPAEDYKIGDVISFGESSKTKSPTTHRIYDIKVQDSEPVYITKGDANDSPDQKEISKREIVGKVLFSVPYIGYAVYAAKQPVGFALIIVVPAGIIIIDEIKKIYAEIKKKKTT